MGGRGRVAMVCKATAFADCAYALSSSSGSVFEFFPASEESGELFVELFEL